MSAVKQVPQTQLGVSWAVLKGIFLRNLLGLPYIRLTNGNAPYTGFRTAVVEEGRASFGAGVSLVAAVGFGTTTSAAASSVAAMSELRSSLEENIVTGQP